MSKADDRAIEGFLDSTHQLAKYARSVERDGGGGESSLMWALMRNARLFVVPPSMYGRFYHSADVYTTEVVAKVPWDLPDEVKAQISETAQKSPALALFMDTAKKAQHAEGKSSLEYVEVVTEAGREVPAPDRLPFEAMFLSYQGKDAGDRITLSVLQAALRRLPTGKKPESELVPSGFFLRGHLLVYVKEEFRAWEIIFHEESGQVLSYSVYSEHEWTNPFDLNPWVVNGLIASLLEYQTHVIENQLDFMQRRKYGKKSKGGKIPMPLPKPYYTVYLRDKVIDDSARKTNEMLQSKTFEYAYRFDVRGHERCRIRRGDLPIDSKVADTLAQRGYKIYTLDPLSGEDAARLLQRKIAGKSAKEWLAIKIKWVDQFQKGPAKAPYIPALRKGS